MCSHLKPHISHYFLSFSRGVFTTRPKSLSQRPYVAWRPRGSGYDSGGEDRMTISDAMHYARSEFGFEADRGAGSWGLAVYMHSW